MTNSYEKTVVLNGVAQPTELCGAVSNPSADQAGSLPEEGAMINQRGDALRPGTLLSEFEVCSVKGVGGFSIVYLAIDHLLKRTVALKEYMPSAIAMRSAATMISVRTESQKEAFMVGLRSFINEAQLLARFDHPALVKVYRFWEANGTAYMVMPYYDGTTLKEVLRHRVEPPDELWLKTLLRPLLEALAVMHCDDCYHRDIAPDNIIIDHGNLQPVLLDLGAARRVINDMTQMLTVILKPGYAPVEQYAEAPGMKQGPWTDVYALGAVVHFAILGKTPPASISRLLNDSYVPLAEAAAGRYSDSFLHTIDAALSVRPESRPQSIKHLADALGINADMPGHAYNGSGTGSTWSGRAIARTELSLLATQSNGNSTRQSSIQSASSATVQRSRAWWVAAGVGVAALLAGGGQWLARKPVSPANATSGLPISKYTPADEFKRIAALADPSIRVTVALQNAVARIGNDYLKFGVHSSRDGYLYIFMVDAEGKQYRLLFPNDYDTENRISAGQTIALPSPSWPMLAGAPAGATRFLALVSLERREFASAGATPYSIFQVFPPQAQIQSAAARTASYSPFAGRPVCRPDTVECSKKYGAATFEILGVVR